MTNKRKLTLVFIVIILVIIALTLGLRSVSKKSVKSSGTYVVDPLSGDQMFNDPRQTPEKAGGGLQSSLINSDVLLSEITTDQLVAFRTTLDAYMTEKNESPNKSGKVYVADRLITRKENMSIIPMDV